MNATASSPAPNLDYEEQRIRISRMIDEAEKFSAEQKKLIAEQSKLAAEQSKLTAEALKLGRDRMLAPWQIALSGMVAGAAFFGAGAAFVKLIGP